MQLPNLKCVQQQYGGDYIGPTTSMTGVSIDTRTLDSGEVFVALDGANVQGAQFCLNAQKKGASAVVVTEKSEAISIGQWVVADSIKALQNIGNYCRNSANNAKVVAITGSTGKTTVKEMLHSILCRHYRQQDIVTTEGNYNNEIGVPLTLAKMTPKTRVACIEMGARQRGDIALLCQLARPQLRLITNISSAHIAGFGSVEGVASAKGEIYHNLGDGEWAFVNLDNAHCRNLSTRIAPQNLITFSCQDSTADVYCTDIAVTTKQSFKVHYQKNKVSTSFTVALQVLGNHQVENAMAAISIALALQVPSATISAAVAEFKQSMRRLEHHKLSDGNILIDDSYNANPASTVVALQYLEKVHPQSNKLIVLGSMADLGTESKTLHREILHRCQKFDYLLFGELWDDVEGVEAKRVYKDREQLINTIVKRLQKGHTTVLIKGSRSMYMDRVTDTVLSIVNKLI